MIENTDLQKLKNQYPEFFEKFPPELLEFVFSEDLPSKIAEVCFINEIEDEEKIEKISFRVTLVLLKQIPKENFTEILIKGVQLDPDLARKVHEDIERTIFAQSPEIAQNKEQLKKKSFANIGEILFGLEAKKPENLQKNSK